VFHIIVQNGLTRERLIPRFEAGDPDVFEHYDPGAADDCWLPRPIIAQGELRNIHYGITIGGIEFRHLNRNALPGLLFST